MTAVERLRLPRVAGYFYPSAPEELREHLRSLFGEDTPHRRVVPGPRTPGAHAGAVVPHAGWQYSGRVAASTLQALEIPARCVVLAPNHTGWGQPWSLMAHGAYASSLGEVPIDEGLAAALLEACPLLEDDAAAHRAEHAIEVLLPMVQWLRPEGLTLVPLVIGSEAPDEYARVGQALAAVLAHSAAPALVLASADFTHYEPREDATRKDRELIEAVLALDAERFVGRIRSLGVAMCGTAPVACLIEAARRLGLANTRLVRYATSADAGGDPHAVVGYAGILLEP